MFRLGRTALGLHAFAAPRMRVSCAPLRFARSASTDELSRARHLQQQLRAQDIRKRNQSIVMYTASGFIIVLGLCYAAVPLYRAFCSATGYSGTPMTDRSRYSDESRLRPSYTDPFDEERKTQRIRVAFNASHSDQIPWSFVPEQREIYVLPGETALTFFKAHNPTDHDIIGIATYNVVPDRIAPYFAKIECFCFEEQKLLAGEEVDLPVFFFLDKEMLEDTDTRDVKDVMLSYTFFSARRNPVTGQLEPDTDLSKYRVGMDA
ncbi:Cytochrome c oxidase assembly protein cox11, mitochondrial [Malassezia furfur]|uniref:Cytochrome c oxidase assembly protein cox11, mitochondrial n=1 Tax=Malassezia furfur TaxID=55194 RepID=A0ABY8ESB3_MALFU|nr:COX11 [Malassezia furfur]WFD47315.1 Cytochrome c oxidase assembly protein cox11, mitochondrial [Malassezia furfur]